MRKGRNRPHNPGFCVQGKNRDAEVARTAESSPVGEEACACAKRPKGTQLWRRRGFSECRAVERWLPVRSLRDQVRDTEGAEQAGPETSSSSYIPLLCFHLLHLSRVCEILCLKKGFCDFKKDGENSAWTFFSSQLHWGIIDKDIDFCEEVNSVRKVGSL